MQKKIKLALEQYIGTHLSVYIKGDPYFAKGESREMYGLLKNVYSDCIVIIEKTNISQFSVIENENILVIGKHLGNKFQTFYNNFRL